MKALQTRAMPVMGQQSPTVGLQSTVIPAQTNGIDMSSIMNMMLMMVVMVMMMKMMTSATANI